MGYTSPKVSEIGSVRDITLAGGKLNKIGDSSDVLTALSGGIVVGSFVPR